MIPFQSRDPAFLHRSAGHATFGLRLFDSPGLTLARIMRSDDDPFSAQPLSSKLYRDWSAFAFSEKVSDPDGAQHPEGRFGHRGQTPFPQHLSCRGITCKSK